MTAEFRHSLDQYLATVQQPPACIDVDGNLMLEVGEQLMAHAALLPDGRIELFAGAGYVTAELLQFIVEMDEDDVLDPEMPRHVADVMARWTGDSAHWAIDVDRRTGLLSLSMSVAVPGDPAEWAAVLHTFRCTGASWIARLQRDAPNLLPHPGAGLCHISPGAFLRC